MDCFADDREAFKEYEKYFKSSYLSDVTLIVGGKKFPAHRLILARGSDVFERMLSSKWDGNKKEIELSEDSQCVDHFETFLKFFYFNHAVFNDTNALPLLILADKYNFKGLQKVCIQYAISYVLKEASLKDILNVWFNYSSKACHSILIRECVRIIASNMTKILTSEEWTDDWASLDRDQITEILKSNDLIIPNEYLLYQSIQKWINAENSPERKGSTLTATLIQILPWIRFPYMKAEELSELEGTPLAQTHVKLFMPFTHTAFKYISLPLSLRTTSDFTTSQFLLRSYTDLSWDNRIVITNEQLYERGVDHSFKISTRASTVDPQTWNWTLKFTIASTVPNSHDQLKLNLASDDIDHSRSVEYLISVVGERKILRQVWGMKNFTKTRYHTDLDLQSKINVNELFSENSPLLVHGCLHLQLNLRPVL
uniref:BTB domain-containing protein n=1 Tax=Panagrolaimus sp. ES5 TaxID=591445 RepID=A0AC34F195_9BILA